MSLQDRLRLELRPIDARGHGWVEPLNRALAEAYRNRSPEDIAAVALLGAVKLDAAGRYAEALANLDFALSLVGAQSPQRAHLLCARAALLAIAGDLDGARVAIELAAAGRIEDDRGQIELDVYRALVGCLALAPDGGADPAAPIGGAEPAGLDWLASGLTVWFVPWLAAFGERVSARAWLWALTARAHAADHRGRAGDARALAIALDGVRAGASAPEASPDCGPLEAWRLALVRLRIAQLEGDADRADRAIGIANSCAA